MLTGLGASDGLRMGAETLLPVMFMKASAKSLDKVAGEADRINFADFGVIGTTKTRGCCMLERGITKLKLGDGCKKILF
jgi:hypothetical protein